MSEHKILSIVEEMAQGNEVMSEQKYKEIADLLMVRQKEGHVKPYKIYYLQSIPYVKEVSEGYVQFGNTMHSAEKIVYMDEEYFRGFKAHIQERGFTVSEPKISKYDFKDNRDCGYKAPDCNILVDAGILILIKIEEFIPQ